MPRSVISLDPIDPPTPIADGQSKALASILQGITRRRELDMLAEDQQYRRGREATQDNLAERRMALEERRAADNQKRMAALLDLKQAGGGTGGPIRLKDARSLALRQAQLEAGEDEFGNPVPVSQDRVDELTEHLLRYGDQPQGQPAAPASQPPAAAPVAEEEPGMISKWLEHTKNGAETLYDAAASLFDGEGETAAPAEVPAVSATKTTEYRQPAPGQPATPEEIERVEREFMAGAGGFGVMAPRHLMRRPDAAGAAKTPAPVLVNPNTPDPAPEYLDVLEKLGTSDPDRLVKILRELKARSPEEFAAVDAAIRRRRQEPARAR